MAYLSGYCDVAFANTVNKSDEWSNASAADKEFSLTMGRLYIDQKYTCSDTSTWDTTDYTTIPDEVQRANAILGEDYIKGELTQTEVPVSGPITSKRVKAGSVESETTYLGYYSTATKKFDPKQEVTMLLSPYCTLGGSKTLIRV